MTDENDSMITKFFKVLWSIIKWFFIIVGFIVSTLVIVQLIIKNNNPLNVETKIYNLFKRNIQV